MFLITHFVRAMLFLSAAARGFGSGRVWVSRAPAWHVAGPGVGLSAPKREAVRWYGVAVIASGKVLRVIDLKRIGLAAFWRPLQARKLSP